MTKPSEVIGESFCIAVLAGDGIGPEVTAQALKALQSASDRFGFKAHTSDYNLGAERYLKSGTIIDDATISELRDFDAILLGAMGDPRVPPGVLERGLIVRIRTVLEQSVNLRPIRLYPGVQSPLRNVTPTTCDLVIVRENSEGLYAGGGGTVHSGTPNAVATQESVTTASATLSVIQYAFQLAQQRRKKLTLCHKTNILLHAGALWIDTFERLSEQFPDVELDYVHVDAMCQHMILSPERFDVVVTDNLFGDIISDLGATISGGLGVAASGNLNITSSAPSMFEPTHGSAPDISGRGWANPAAAVLSAAMCLASLGQEKAALACEAATASVIAELGGLAGPQMGASTDQIGDRIASRIADGTYDDFLGDTNSIMIAIGALQGPT